MPFLLLCYLTGEAEPLNLCFGAVFYTIFCELIFVSHFPFSRILKLLLDTLEVHNIQHPEY